MTPRGWRRLSRVHADPTTTPRRSTPKSKSKHPVVTQIAGQAGLRRRRRHHRQHILPATHRSPKCLQCPQFGASSNGAASSTPQPHKRPRSAWKRFCAEQPNELWQADVTHWHLADHTEVEILDILDDHSRARPRQHTPDPSPPAPTSSTPSARPSPNGAYQRARSPITAPSSPPNNAATDAPPWKSPWANSASNTAAPAPTTRRPAARLNASTKPSKNTYGPYPPAATIDRAAATRSTHFLVYYNTIRPHRALGPPHTPRGIQRPAQGIPQRLPDPAALPGTPRQNRRWRGHHHPLQQPPTSHRANQAPTRHQSHRPHRRPRHPRPRPRHRHTDPQTDPRPHPRLPTTRRQMRKLTRKQAPDVNDVSGHLSTMSRDITQ